MVVLASKETLSFWTVRPHSSNGEEGEVGERDEGADVVSGGETPETPSFHKLKLSKQLATFDVSFGYIFQRLILCRLIISYSCPRQKK